MTWVRIPPGAAHFFFKRRESEPSQVVVLCCLALFIVSQLFNRVHDIHEVCLNYLIMYCSCLGDIHVHVHCVTS